MAILFFILHILSFSAAIAARRYWLKHLDSLRRKTWLQPLSRSLLAIVLLYIFISYLFKISIKGVYSDFIIGFLIFCYLDLVFVAVFSETKFGRFYTRCRLIYCGYNAVRISIILFLSNLTLVSVTYPAGNIDRNKSVAIFNDLVINSNSFVTFTGIKCEFKVYETFSFFEKELLCVNVCPEYADPYAEIKMVGKDSMQISGLNSLIYRKNGHIYFKYYYGSEQLIK